MTADATLAADGVERELVGRYVTAFERYDIDTLTALIREDAIGSAGSDVHGRDETETAGGASVATRPPLSRVESIPAYWRPRSPSWR